LATLEAEPAAGIAARFSITEARARSLAPGVAILAALMARYGVDSATAVEEGIREGVVIALARGGRAWRDRLDALAHGWGG
jgi:exopolyphosphatase/pppGpp-phosphohydrolase